jgi:hypothetical protein
MQREGIDKENVEPEDILCDFCESAAWAAGEPCVEGHQGSIICGDCLKLAYEKLILSESDEQSSQKCRMCLEDRDEPSWLSKVDPSATICFRCMKQAAAVLQKSKHWDWVKPTSD